MARDFDPMPAESTPPETDVFQHQTVLLEEVLTALEPRAGGVYLDVTLGGGGHAEAILARSSPDGILLGVDRDPAARAAASKRLAAFGNRVRIHAGTMRDARTIVRDEGFDGVDGLVADLGVSSPQLDDPARGMSFRASGPLDMRMDPDGPETAYNLVRALNERDLADVIYQYGEERASRPIARNIKQAVARNEMDTTVDLARCVYRVLGPPRPGRGIDPATRTFQALRIAVNDELGELKSLLEALPELLRDGGRAAVISFHSLEDRLVKHTLRETETLEVITRKPVIATDREQHENPRARSAKLRVAERLARENDS